jgi:hypothetical protein
MSRMTDYCDVACDICFVWKAGTETTLQAMRSILHKKGWKTVKASGKTIDLCPECADGYNKNKDLDNLYDTIREVKDKD